MTWKLRTRDGYVQYEIRTAGPDGRPILERKKCPVQSQTGARAWTQRRELHLARHGDAPPPEETPTLERFAERWVREYAEANGNKASTVDTKKTINRLHLVPVLGQEKLDSIGEVAVQRLKLHLVKKEPKTIACVLSQLATMLRTAARWGVIAVAPDIELPRVPKPEMVFYPFVEWERLVAAAKECGPEVYAFVLLGGEAGLRRGELVALEQDDCNGGAVVVRRNEWRKKGQVAVSTPKGGSSRRIPMTPRLAAAVAGIKHLRGKRLLWQVDGKPARISTLQSWLEKATRRAGLEVSRDIHRLRHTFCSHLAARGAPIKAIQTLAGHSDIATTARYMHLAPGGTESAIALLAGGGTGAVQEAARPTP
jgi:integrase